MVYGVWCMGMCRRPKWVNGMMTGNKKKGSIINSSKFIYLVSNNWQLARSELMMMMAMMVD